MRGSSGARRPKRTKRECVEADHQRRRPGRLIGRPVLDRDKPLTRRRGIGVIGRRDARVIAVHAVQLREFGPLDVQPTLDAGVPRVGGLPQVLGRDRVRRRVGQIGGDEERRDLGGNGERRVSRLFFPSILRTDGAVAREKDGRPAHHRPQRIPSGRVDHALARRKIDEENRECGFVHLHAVPVGPAVEPHVLRPVAIRLLRHLQVAQHAPDVLVRADGDEAARDLDEVPRPHQVIAAEIVVRLRESPRNREAGDDPAFHTLRFVCPQHGGADLIEPGSLRRAGRRPRAARARPATR